MAQHKLEGGVTVDVLGIETSFSGRPPIITGSGRERVLEFSRPTNAAPIASVKFRFKVSGPAANFSFGVKQVCIERAHQALYVGLKDENGSISQETNGFDGVPLLDLSPKALTVLFDAKNFATGAIATAPQAPFFDTTPMPGKAGVETTLGLTDHPGANFRSELQNGATDRPNFLDRVRMRKEFVTALVAVQFKNNLEVAHIPLEGVRWENKSFVRVEWNGDAMTLKDGRHEALKVADIASFGSEPEVAVLSNKALTAKDCIAQKFNDALFSAQGAFAQQNYNNPTQKLTVVGTRGVRYIQFPVVAD